MFAIEMFCLQKHVYIFSQSMTFTISTKNLNWRGVKIDYMPFYIQSILYLSMHMLHL